MLSKVRAPGAAARRPAARGHREQFGDRGLDVLGANPVERDAELDLRAGDSSRWYSTLPQRNRGSRTPGHGAAVQKLQNGYHREEWVSNPNGGPCRSRRAATQCFRAGHLHPLALGQLSRRSSPGTRAALQSARARERAASAAAGGRLAGRHPSRPARLTRGHGRHSMSNSTTVEVFPVTDVIYIEIGAGLGTLPAALRDEHVARWISQEPFPYHPHITLAQEIPHERVARMTELARRRWAEYSGLPHVPGGTRRFRAEHAGQLLDRSGRVLAGRRAGPLISQATSTEHSGHRR